jgi:hypothetical protein
MTPPHLTDNGVQSGFDPFKRFFGLFGGDREVEQTNTTKGVAGDVGL